MVNRAKENVAARIDKINESGQITSRSHASEIISPYKNRSKENTANDELIGTLADAHENRRAQQVNEWEQMRRLYLSRAA